MFSSLIIALIASASGSHAAYGRRQLACPTGAPTNLNSNALPNSTEANQSGYNNCGTTDGQNTMCQTAWLNSLDDFCLWAPSSPNMTIGDSERDEVAWCTKAGHGARLIPDGTITGAHFVVTKDYVQITGIGDMTKINIATGDQGGELDPHGADGCGNPIGGILFTNAFGQQGQQIAEWTNFMDADSFCFRGCIGSNAAVQCNHIYDVMGCTWNMPGNYSTGFDQCLGDDDAPMGVYDNGASTWYQGQSPTPSAGTFAPVSSCTTTSSIGNGFLASTSTPVMSTSPATANGTASSSGSMTTSGSSASATATSAKSAAGALTASFGLVGAAAVAAVAAFL